MKLDIDEIRQSPRAFVDLETVIALSDRVMVLEIKLLEAESQWRICDVTATVREAERDEFAALNALLGDALKKLACLGNSDSYGNSIGNCIAIEALALPDHASEILRKRDAGVFRTTARWARICGGCEIELLQIADDLEAGD